MSNLYVIMPVKDSLTTAQQAINAIIESGHTLTVYDDNSTPENAALLDVWSRKQGFEVIHLCDKTNHPSPNYRWILIETQRKCIENGQHLIIVESDVIVAPKTIDTLLEAVSSRKVGMVAAVTHSVDGDINFPYEYARRIKKDGLCRKRFSFCCTLLTNYFLHAYDFEQLNPEKNWYDVHISHMSVNLGYENILQVSNPVIHKPHSSRPWKQLKYTNPFLYYWRKFTTRKDRI